MQKSIFLFDFQTIYVYWLHRVSKQLDKKMSRFESDYSSSSDSQDSYNFIIPRSFIQHASIDKEGDENKKDLEIKSSDATHAQMHVIQISNDNSKVVQRKQAENGTVRKALVGSGLLTIIVYCFYFSNAIHKETIRQLKQDNKLLKQKNQELNTVVTRQRQQIAQLKLTIRQGILQLDQQVLQRDGGIFTFINYSDKFNFIINQNIKNFNYHYSINGKRVKKRSEQQRMFYTKDSIPPTGTHFIKVKIVSTLSGMISIGVIPQAKKNQECVYCDIQDTYYLYCANGNIYNGKILFIHHSRSTRIGSVKSGDVVTMFINRNKDRIYWYVNNLYIASQSIQRLKFPIHPFIAMSSRGDQIQLLN